MRINFSELVELQPFPWEEVLNQDEYWLDKWGNKHDIKEMSTDYIRNCLPFAESAAMGIGTVIASLPFNGDMAQFYAEREMDRYWSLELPLIEALREELERRGET